MPWNMSLRFVSTTRFHSPIIMSPTGSADNPMPALLNSGYTRPPWATVRSNRVVTGSGSVTSVITARPCSEAAAVSSVALSHARCRPATATHQPLASSACGAADAAATDGYKSN